MGEPLVEDDNIFLLSLPFVFSYSRFYGVVAAIVLRFSLRISRTCKGPPYF